GRLKESSRKASLVREAFPPVIAGALRQAKTHSRFLMCSSFLSHHLTSSLSQDAQWERRPMRMFPRHVPQPRQGIFSRDPGLLLILTASVLAAAGGAFVLDWYRKSKPVPPSPPDPSFLSSDRGPNGWAYVLPPGTAAPPFTLQDFRTGEKVSLSDFHRHRPVVFLFGSFG